MQVESGLIDFREIPNAEEFESLVRELFIELGYRVENTGKGPDSGADLIVEHVSSDDLIGGPQRRRYVLQCKHYSSSGRSVGRLEGLSIIDCINRYNADGYHLVVSTSITSSLRNDLVALRDQGRYTITYWDEITLRRELLKFPNLVARYFRSNYRRKFRPSRPQAQRKARIYDRIVEHQDRWVGVKFIPELYIARDLETSVNALFVTMAMLDTVSAHLNKSVHVLADTMESFPLLPRYVAPMLYTSDIYEWKCNVEAIHIEKNRISEALRKIKSDLRAAYLSGGHEGVRSSIADFRTSVGALAQKLLAVLSPIDRGLDSIKTEEKRCSLARATARSSNTQDMLDRARWNREHILGTSVFRRSRKRRSVHFETSQSLLRRLGQLKSCVSEELLTPVADVLKRILTRVRVIVDAAGSGKTNVCCRIALNCSHHSFSIFLTGRSHGQVFERIADYLDSRISESFPERSGRPLVDNCAWLAEREFPVVLIIDGVNEAPDYLAMNRELQELLKLVGDAPISVLLSSRIEYWPSFEPLFALSDATQVTVGELSNFSDEELEAAVPAYLAHYNLQVRFERGARERLRRPLLLRFFCEAFGNPSASSVRRLPTLIEVHLAELFREYCRVKYRNIRDATARQLSTLTTDDVASFLFDLASVFLDARQTTLPVSELRSLIVDRWRGGDLLLRALLDEDIILQEYIDIASLSGRRARIGFVYEAFMEFLMAAVLIRRAARNDSALVLAVEDLLDQRRHFSNVLGILAFIAPEAGLSFPHAFQQILAVLRQGEFREACLPALLNMNCNAWQQGVRELVDVAFSHLPAVSPEDLRLFLYDRIIHKPEALFLDYLLQDPKRSIVVLGSTLAEVLTEGAKSLVVEAYSCIIAILRSEAASYNLVVALTDLLSSQNFASLLREKGVFGPLLDAYRPIFSGISAARYPERDWEVLWRLARVGRSVGVELIDVPEWIRKVVELAIRDHFRRMQFQWESDVRWWVMLTNVDPKKARADLWAQDDQDVREGRELGWWGVRPPW